MKERCTYIDVAKGICMIMVIWMHVCNNMSIKEMMGPLNIRIGTMYMPCFFILSGFFIATRANKWTYIINKKWNTLLKPFLFMYAFSAILAYLVEYIIPGVLKNSTNVFAILASRNFTNGPIWFLSALFGGLMIVNGIFMFNNIFIRILFILISFLTGFYWIQLSPSFLV